MDGPGAGFQYPPRKVTWTKRDVLLFNITIGCGPDELQFAYEHHHGFQPFPTLPLGLVFKLDNQEVIDFYATQKPPSIPGVPVLDPKYLVDGDRTIQFIKPLPVSSAGRDFEFRSKVLGVFDKGNAGTVVRSEDLLVDVASNETYARIVGSLFYIGQGNWGGQRGPAATRYLPPKDTAPDVDFNMHIDEQSAHLYRLNGDYNPLHATPEIGKEMGFGGIIVHGVYLYNRIALEIVRKLGHGDPGSLKEISARFNGIVRPGDNIKLQLWLLVPNSTPGSVQEVRWTATNLNTGKVCLSDGRALMKGRGLESKI